MYKRIIKLLPILEANKEHSVSNSLFGGLLIYISELSKSEQERFIKDIEKSVSSFYELVHTEDIVEVQVISKEMNYIVGKMFSPDEIAESASSMYASFDKLIKTNNENTPPPSQADVTSPLESNNDEVTNAQINPSSQRGDVSSGDKKTDEGLPKEEEPKDSPEDNIIAFGFVEEGGDVEEDVKKEEAPSEEPMDSNTVDTEPYPSTDDTSEGQTSPEEDDDVFGGLFNELEGDYEDELVLSEEEEDINTVLREES